MQAHKCTVLDSEAKRRKATHSGYKNWKSELDQECQTMTWLYYESKRVADKRVHLKLLILLVLLLTPVKVLKWSCYTNKIYIKQIAMLICYLVHYCVDTNVA